MGDPTLFAKIATIVGNFGLSYLLSFNTVYRPVLVEVVLKETVTHEALKADGLLDQIPYPVSSIRTPIQYLSFAKLNSERNYHDLSDEVPYFKPICAIGGGAISQIR